MRILRTTRRSATETDPGRELLIALPVRPLLTAWRGLSSPVPWEVGGHKAEA
jgi:hypothetical protein